MPAADFLDVPLPRRRGSRATSTGSPCTPTRSTPKRSKKWSKNCTKSRSKTTTGCRFYITEMGWGSQNDFNIGRLRAGDPGPGRASCAPPTASCCENWRRLDLKHVYWFSWKDLPGIRCSFCDSVGLFRDGPRFHAKPAWRAFVALTGGRARPEPGAGAGDPDALQLDREPPRGDVGEPSAPTVARKLSGGRSGGGSGRCRRGRGASSRSCVPPRSSFTGSPVAALAGGDPGGDQGPAARA